MIHLDLADVPFVQIAVEVLGAIKLRQISAKTGGGCQACNRAIMGGGKHEGWQQMHDGELPTGPNPLYGGVKHEAAQHRRLATRDQNEKRPKQTKRPRPLTTWCEPKRERTII